MNLPTVRFVLLRPRYSGNLGAAARALKNFGFAEWSWVCPQTEDLDEGRKLAVHAQDLLERAQIWPSLDEAVSDCVWVVGTSSRKVEGKRRLSPRELAQKWTERSADGPMAVVFGDERSGLTNEELHRCHDFSAISAHQAQPSLNLAQAVLLYAYELHQALAAISAPPPRPKARSADDRLLSSVEDALRDALRQRGFLSAGERHAVRDLFGTLRRSELSAREAQLWLAALKVIAKNDR
jgi:tRNA/rRNA methyltransferase